MPDIYHTLLGHDLGHLQIIAELWGIELESNELDKATKKLAASLLDPERLDELMDSLTPPAREALNALTESNGRIPYANFVRQFGDIREMGAGKRDRERPHLKPSSTSEVLFYRGLIARAFFDTDQGPQEFAYIPDDLFEIIYRGENNKTDRALCELCRLAPACRCCSRHERCGEIRISWSQCDTRRKSLHHPCNRSRPR